MKPTKPFAALCLIATMAQAQSPAPFVYPESRKTEQTDTYHGVTVADPYRWLEDDNSAETKAWVKAQNAVTDKYLEAMPQRAPVKKLYTELFNFEKFGIPTKEGGRYLFTRNDGLQQQAVVYTMKSLTEKPAVAIDPNLLSKDGTVALTGMQLSRDGRYLAYGTAGAGSDWQQWQVRDLTTGKDLPDLVKWVKFSSAAWTRDGKGFFYSRYDAPKEGEKLTGVNYFQKLYYHRIGEDQSKDVLVLENKNEKEWGFSAGVSEDGNHLLVSIWKGSGRKNGVMHIPLPNGAFKGNAATPVTLTFDSEYAVLGNVKNLLYVRTDKDAPKGRIITIDLMKSAPEHWKTVVSAGQHAMTSASLVGGKIIAEYLQDAASAVTIYDLKGRRVRDIALPGIGTAAGFGGRLKSAETFFSYTSLTTPTEIWRYDVSTGKAVLFKRPKTAMNPDDYIVKREFVVSRDGTKVPVFIGHRKDLKVDGSAPALLYGYGGFNVPMTPGFSATFATWMRMGGVYALAVLRGGGEYGGDWHDAGTKLRKQNVFDDFIAQGEWLIANQYTSPKRLVINGGSNGGLLVGAVLNQRPELFGAAIPQVGVMDMLRYHKFTIGWAWATDYGTADKADEFKALHAYSPLHTVKRDKAYPPVLITTADHDDRVVPAHSFKYTAEMQAAATEFSKSGNVTGPVLARIEVSAGHGAGKPTSKIIEERSDMLAFAANAVGLVVK
jgi:prolyl oligopeptidase